MAKADVTKEEIGYLKLWLGVVVVTLISLISWLVTRASDVGVIVIVVGWLGVVALVGFMASLHVRISELIQELEEL